MTMLRTILRALAPHTAFSRVDALSRTPHAAERMRMLVRAFYFFMLYGAVNAVFGYRTFLEYPASLFSPPLPLMWAFSVPFTLVLALVIGGFLFGAFAAALLPFARPARVIAFVSFLEYQALATSFGTVPHGWILLNSIAFLLIFMPDASAETATRHERKKVLAVSWAVAASIFTLYTLTGAGKLFNGVDQLMHAQASVFSLDAGALHAADWANSTGMLGLLGPTIIHYPLLGWIGFVGIMLLQLGCFAVMFCPRLYRVAGTLLILSHVAIFLGIGITFIESTFVLALFLLAHPLAMREG